MASDTIAPATKIIPAHRKPLMAVRTDQVRVNEDLGMTSYLVCSLPSMVGSLSVTDVRARVEDLVDMFADVRVLVHGLPAVSHTEVSTELQITAITSDSPYGSSERIGAVINAIVITWCIKHKVDFVGMTSAN
jgi:hypothetical protein